MMNGNDTINLFIFNVFYVTPVQKKNFTLKSEPLILKLLYITSIMK